MTERTEQSNFSTQLVPSEFNGFQTSIEDESLRQRFEELSDIYAVKSVPLPPFVLESEDFSAAFELNQTQIAKLIKEVRKAGVIDVVTDTQWSAGGRPVKCLDFDRIVGLAAIREELSREEDFNFREYSAVNWNTVAKNAQKNLGDLPAAKVIHTQENDKSSRDDAPTEENVSGEVVFDVTSPSGRIGSDEQIPNEVYEYELTRFLDSLPDVIYPSKSSHRAQRKADSKRQTNGIQKNEQPIPDSKEKKQSGSEHRKKPLPEKKKQLTIIGEIPIISEESLNEDLATWTPDRLIRVQDSLRLSMHEDAYQILNRDIVAAVEFSVAYRFGNLREEGYNPYPDIDAMNINAVCDAFSICASIIEDLQNEGFRVDSVTDLYKGFTYGARKQGYSNIQVIEDIDTEGKGT